MELVDLRIFVAVMEEGSATRAAAHLAMTQPGVSQHLAKLEGELGSKLFERNGKRLWPSEFGKNFLGKAKKLLADAEALKGMATGVSMPMGTLKLGLTDASTETVIPPALMKFRKQYPGVHVRLDVDDSGDIEEGVIRGHYDLGIITSSGRPNPLLSEVTLYHDRIDAIASKNHEIASRKRVTLEDLVKATLLIYPRRSRTRQMIDDVFHSKGLVPRDVIDVYINTAAVRLAEAGVGVALLPLAFIESEMQRHRCAHIRIKGDPFSRCISLVSRRGTHLTDAAARFSELLMGKGSSH